MAHERTKSVGSETHIKTQSRETPLAEATLNNSVDDAALILSTENKDVNISYEFYPGLSLDAIENQNSQFLSNLLNHSNDIDTINTCYETILKLALDGKNKKMLEMILKHTSKPTVTENNLNLAASFNDINIFKLLLKHHTNQNYIVDHFKNTFSRAGRLGSDPDKWDLTDFRRAEFLKFIAKELIIKVSFIEALNICLQASHDLDVVELTKPNSDMKLETSRQSSSIKSLGIFMRASNFLNLLDPISNVINFDKMHSNPIYLFITKVIAPIFWENWALNKVLDLYAPGVKEESQTLLLFQILIQNIQGLKQALKNPHIDINFRYSDLNLATPLHIAIGSKNFQLIKVILENPNINPGITNGDGLNTIEYATKNGYTKTLEVIFDNADINLLIISKAINYASQFLRYDCFILLLNYHLDKCFIKDHALELIKLASNFDEESREFDFEEYISLIRYVVDKLKLLTSSINAFKICIEASQHVRRYVSLKDTELGYKRVEKTVKYFYKLDTLNSFITQKFQLATNNLPDQDTQYFLKEIIFPVFNSELSGQELLEIYDLILGSIDLRSVTINGHTDVMKSYLEFYKILKTALVAKNIINPKQT